MINTGKIQAECKRAELMLVVALALEQMGVSSGEMTYARASRVYGEWFVRATKSGRITPVRVGAGRKATRWYAVSDILALKAVELERAEVILRK